MFKDVSQLIPYVRKYRGEFLQGVLTLILASLCAASIPFLIKYAVDGLQSGSYRYVARIVLITCFLAVAQALLRYRSRMKILHSAREIEYELRQDFFRHLIALPYSFFREHHRGDLIARMMNDIGNIRMMVGLCILHFSSTITTTLFSLAMMLKLSAVITLLSIFPLLFLLLLIKGYMSKLHRIFKELQDANGALSKGINEVLSGIRVIKNYLLQGDERKRFNTLNETYMEKNMAATRVWGLMFPSMGFLGGMGTLLVMWIGGYFMIQKRITLGDFIALNTYYTMLMWPIAALGWILNLYQRGVASLRRIEEIYASKAEVSEGTAPERFEGGLSLRNVSLVKAGRPVLSNVNFSLKPREKLLIIGPTGSGKSTIMNLILGLEEAHEGTLLLDSVDAAVIPIWFRRTRIAIVPQDPFLYSLSVRENIFSEHDLDTLIDAVHMKEEIDRFERRFDTLVGERGVMLSGGQKQRLTLARALSVKPSILLLDDPFTHVDGYTEHIIWQKIWPLLDGMTVIITSTKPVPMSYLDKVLVLMSGSVVDEGAPLDVLERNPYMKLLYEVGAEKGEG